MDSFNALQTRGPADVLAYKVLYDLNQDELDDVLYYVFQLAEYMRLKNASS